MTIRDRKDWVVYSLSGPDGVVRCVGLTSNPRTRLRQHYYGSSVLNPKMREWLRPMRTSRTVVTMRVLESVRNAYRIDATTVERRNILKLLDSGAPLFNAKPKMRECHFVYVDDAKPVKKSSKSSDLRYLRTGVRT